MGVAVSILIFLFPCSVNSLFDAGACSVRNNIHIHLMSGSLWGFSVVVITEIPLSSRSVHFLTAVIQYVLLCYPGFPYLKPMTQMNPTIDRFL